MFKKIDTNNVNTLIKFGHYRILGRVLISSTHQIEFAQLSWNFRSSYLHWKVFSVVLKAEFKLCCEAEVCVSKIGHRQSCPGYWQYVVVCGTGPHCTIVPIKRNIRSRTFYRQPLFSAQPGSSDETAGRMTVWINRLRYDWHAAYLRGCIVMLMGIKACTTHLLYQRFQELWAVWAIQPHQSQNQH